MPIIIGLALTALRGVLLRIAFYLLGNAPAIIGNILLALGFYFVVSKPAGSVATSWIIDKFNGAPGTVLETLYYLNMDDYLQITLAAYAARKTMDAGRVMLKKR